MRLQIKRLHRFNRSKKSVPLCLALALALILTAVLAITVTAVHDLDFELEGNIITNSPSLVDWESLFDVSGGVATPKDTLPSNFAAATFSRDFVPGEKGPDPTTFTGSKDINSISTSSATWSCACDNNVGDKVDIVNAYATIYYDGTDMILYFALERFSNEGDGNVGFWFLQDKNVSCTASCAPGAGSSPFVGEHRDGDILVVSEFTNGGVVNTVNAYQWVGDDATGYLDPTPVASGVDCTTSPPGASICAVVNPSIIYSTDIPWLTETKKSGPNPSNDLDTSEFFEGGINLTALGMGEVCFGKFLATTRSSQELTADIKDYAIGDLSICDASITIEPDETNKVGESHTFIVHVDKMIAGVTSPADPGTIVDVTLTPANGAGCVITGDTCATGTDANGNCTITFYSNSAGTVTGHANTTVYIDSEPIPVETDGVAPNSDDAVKTYVNAKIEISPLEYTNSVDTQHELEACVMVDYGDGGGWVNAPDDTPIDFTEISDTASSEFVGGIDSCLSTDGCCSVYIESDQPGVTEVRANSTVTVDTVTFNLETGSGAPNSDDAEKTWVDGSIKWYKEDDAGSLLGGATFEVCRISTYNSETGLFDPLGTPECQFVTDNNPPDGNMTDGVFELDGLILGEYEIREDQAPSGYVGDLVTKVKVGLTISAPDAEIIDAWVNEPPWEGCTPGFWQGGSEDESLGVGGRWLWNDLSDPDWPGSSNPFDHDTLFCDFFANGCGCPPALNSITMWDLIRWEELSALQKRLPVFKAARNLVAAYLNASHPDVNYLYTESELKDMWCEAVNGPPGSFQSLHNELKLANERFCPISASIR